MNKAKKVIALFIAVFAIVAQLASPAAALSSTWQTRFRSFQQINQGNAASYPEHIPVLKLFFYRYDNDYWLWMTGFLGQPAWDYTTFNNGVNQAITDFRCSHGLSAGTTVDADTWAAIASELSISSSSAAGYYFYVTDDEDALNIIWVDRKLNAPQLTYWYELPDYSSDIFEIGN